ncbi:MAG: DUF4142 domain-containing protein [Chitinophagales bacterium]|nr:DUF4142 domain-containing protein [Chitinophagales bacterium]
MNFLKNASFWGKCIALSTLMTSTTVFAQDKKPNLTDAEIASVAVTANKIDVDYGNIALKKSQNAEVRKFAQTMINDHNNIIKQAADLAAKLHVTPKDNAVTQSLLNGQKDVNTKFSKLKGSAFDKAYIENEVAYHESVINAVKTILIPEAKNQELKDLLIKVSPLLEHHIEMAKMAKSKIVK